jgi:NADH-quinone oxidoreductase subunit L
MFRLVILTFYGEHKDHHRIDHIHESPKVMTIPLVILAVLSIFVFYSYNPFNAAEGWISKALERPESVVPASVAAPSTAVFEEAHHHAHNMAMMLSLAVAGLGILIAFMTYQWKKISSDAVARNLAPVHSFLLNKWRFDDLYNGVVVNGVLVMSNAWKWFDNTIVDGVVNSVGSVTRVASFVSGKFDSIVIDGLVNLTAYLSGFSGLVLRKFQTGKVQTYIVFTVFGVMIFYFAFRLF